MNIIPHYNFDDFENNYLQDYVKYLGESEKRFGLLEYYDQLEDYYSELLGVLGQNLFSDNLIEIIRETFDWELMQEFITVKYPKITEKAIIKGNGKHTITYSLDIDSIRLKQQEIGFSLYMELSKIFKFLNNKSIELTINQYEIKKIKNPKSKKLDLSNPKKLALLQVIGFFDLPAISNLSEDKQNEIVALLLDADKKEFVYKNRLNLNSKNPNYQIDKYTAFQYLDEMKAMLNNME